MPLDGFRAGTFEFDDQVAEEEGVPVVLVRFEQLVCLFVGEQVQDQGAERGGVSDRVVQDPGVRGCGDGVCTFGETGDGAEDMVAERCGEETIGESVEIE